LYEVTAFVHKISLKWLAGDLANHMPHVLVHHLLQNYILF